MFSQRFFFFILGEIDLFEAFNINQNSKGFTQVQGPAKELGNAYKIGNSMPRMELPNHVLDEIRSFLIKERRLVIITNVKVKHFSFGTLFSVESKSRGIEFKIVFYDLQGFPMHWFNALYPGEATHKKNGWDCLVGHFPKPLPYLRYFPLYL